MITFWLKNPPSDVATWFIWLLKNPWNGGNFADIVAQTKAGNVTDPAIIASAAAGILYMLLVTNPNGIPTGSKQYPIRSQEYPDGTTWSINMATWIVESGGGPPPPPAAYLTRIIVTPASTLYLARGEQQQIQVSGVFSDGSTRDILSTVQLVSTVPAVASVTSGGLVTALSDGYTLISVEQGGITGNLIVGVIGANTLVAGGSYVLSVTVTNKTVYTGTTEKAPYTFFLRIDVLSESDPLLGEAGTLSFAPGETRKIDFPFSVPAGISGLYTANATLKTGNDLTVLARAQTITGQIITEV